MRTDWRALCEELADNLDHVRPSTFDPPDCLIRARAALAEPVGEGPTDEELKSLAGEHSWDDPNDWIDYLAFARAVLARYGHQPAPPAAGGGELAAWLRANALTVQKASGNPANGAKQRMNRAADLLERQAAPVLEPALARINDILNDSGRVCLADEREALDLARQALEQRQAAPVPVPVSERLPGPEDCLDEGWAWFFSPRVGWRQAVLPVSPAYTHWLPATALPLPQGEVEE